MMAALTFEELEQKAVTDFEMFYKDQEVTLKHLHYVHLGDDGYDSITLPKPMRFRVIAIDTTWREVVEGWLDPLYQVRPLEPLPNQLNNLRIEVYGACFHSDGRIQRYPDWRISDRG